ncbi:hypothetical protein ACFSMW_13365 [Virgibacillus halophilus]|uniref:AP2-like DNA-binding integrase domain-containing protein n=1 Tax=Tigheibacillus halophilus TaxID=361280 RepID=A0ABU5CA16_9BACI|nr:hypothetical protein [Virgibacillus halophilus]
MIDSRKNLCYIVTVNYLAKNGVGETKSRCKTFVSLHSINTQRCQDFAKRKAKEDKQFHMFEEEWISQYTVPLSDYCK